MLRNALVECGNVVLRVEVIVRLEVGSHWTTTSWSYKVLCSAQGSVELRTVTASNDFRKVTRRHHLMGQKLEYLLCTSRHFAISKKSKRERAELLRGAISGNDLSTSDYRCLRSIQVRIHVAAADPKKRCAIAHRQQPFSEPPLQIYHTSDSRKTSEGHQSTACAASGLSNALIVDQADPLRQHGVEQRHVVRLGFDGVGEKSVGALGQQISNRHLFHSHYE
mmetsp:Transcript_54114/g.118615  ORF Transcript_54114/g.118615 Transcript_54114/m.118615 type:complete len:222 (+) Transcript_54114:557-1222(+)